MHKEFSVRGWQGVPVSLSLDTWSHPGLCPRGRPWAVSQPQGPRHGLTTQPPRCPQSVSSRDLDGWFSDTSCHPVRTFSFSQKSVTFPHLSLRVESILLIAVVITHLLNSFTLLPFWTLARWRQWWRTHLPMEQMQEMWAWALGGEGLLEDGMATPTPHQYSCLNPTDRGAWRPADHGVSESQTRLRGWPCMELNIYRSVWFQTINFVPNTAVGCFFSLPSLFLTSHFLSPWLISGGPAAVGVSPYP